MTGQEAPRDTADRAARLLQDRFGGREDCYLVESPDGARWRYKPVNEDLLESHLHGQMRIGLAPDPKRVLYVMADFDGKHRDNGMSLAFTEAIRFAEVVDADAGLVPLLEISRSCAGYHAWLFFDPEDPPGLTEARRIVELALRCAGLPDDGNEGKGHPGIFPHPPGPKGVGRTPFLPWSGLLVGTEGGRFVDANGEALAGQLGALSDVPLVTRSALRTAIIALEEQQKENPEPTPPISDEPAHSTGSPGIPAGRRDTTLTSLAGAMRRRGMSEEAIVEALSVENANRCEPPLPDTQVRKIARSISAYEPANAQLDESETPQLQVVPMGDLLDTPLKPIDWVVSGIVARGRSTLLAAQRKRGKSKLIHALTLDVAAERDLALCYESFPILSSGPILWLDMEQGRDELTTMSHRLIAGGEYSDTEVQRIRDRIFWICRQPIDFNDAAWLNAIHRTVESEGVILTVIDSISAVQADYGSENDNSGRRRMYNNVIAPMLDLGSAVLSLGHTANSHKDSDAQAEMRLRGGGDLWGPPTVRFT